MDESDDVDRASDVGAHLGCRGHNGIRRENNSSFSRARRGGGDAQSLEWCRQRPPRGVTKAREDNAVGCKAMRTAAGRNNRAGCKRKTIIGLP